MRNGSKKSLRKSSAQASVTATRATAKIIETVATNTTINRRISGKDQQSNETSSNKAKTATKR
ncbi:unnamed protein product, partial [Ceratitis capitata]